MKLGNFILSVTAGLLCLSGSSLVPADAATYPMRQVRIELNGQKLSNPSGFTYQVQNTTYMPLFYVQQLLDRLKLTNTWNGSGSVQTWSIHTFYLQEPKSVLDQKSGSITIEVNGKQIATRVDKIVTIDPSSHLPTTYIPIWFIEQTLLALGMQSSWDGTTWNVETNYTDYSKDGTYLGSVTSLTDAKNALVLYPLGYVEDNHGATVFVQPSFLNVDLRYSAPANVNADSINKYLIAQHSPLSGLGQSFINAGDTFGVNVNFLLAVASNESAYGTSELALQKNNLFGYGAFDANATADSGIFPSDDYSIQFEAWELRNHYLNPGADHYSSASGPTLSGVGQLYASDSQWAVKTGQLMYQFATSLGDSVTSYEQYQNGQAAPQPVSASEPVYKLNGASGTVGTDLNYPFVPVYPDASTGDTVQSQLNAGQSVTIDGIVEGMVGGLVKEWYHLTQGGYVNANDVQLTNVYKITVLNSTFSSNVSVSVAGVTQPVTRHVGDYVVSNMPTSKNGQIQVQIADSSIGSVTGYLDANVAMLTQVRE